MMRHLFGDLNLKRLVLVLGLYLSFEALALACPACAVSNAQRNSWQTFWMLSVMGFLPLVVAAIIAVFIVRIQKNDKIKITHP